MQKQKLRIIHKMEIVALVIALLSLAIDVWAGSNDYEMNHVNQFLIWVTGDLSIFVFMALIVYAGIIKHLHQDNTDDKIIIRIRVYKKVVFISTCLICIIYIIANAWINPGTNSNIGPCYFVGAIIYGNLHGVETCRLKGEKVLTLKNAIWIVISMVFVLFFGFGSVYGFVELFQ